jgi:hypothetical protein
MHRLSLCKPIHIINVALNLVHGKNLAWQERKASSFTISPLAAGNPHLGYRRAETYAERISLGTALGVSGAAASPSMGYHSSPPLAFLMTLFNVRLGQWLGNPRIFGQKRRDAGEERPFLLGALEEPPKAALRSTFKRYALVPTVR